MIYTDDIDFILLSEEKCVYLVAAPSNSLSSILVGLFLNAFLDNIVSYIDDTPERMSSIPINLIVGASTVMDANTDVDRKLAMLRFRNIHATIIDDDMIMNYKSKNDSSNSFWTTIVANCDEFVYFGGNNTERDSHKNLLKLIAERGGYEVVSIGGEPKYPQPLVRQEKLEQLEDGECIVFFNQETTFS